MPYAAGCRGCGAPCEGARCEGCKEKRRAEKAALRARRREHGLCLTCGDPVAPTKLQGTGTGEHKRVRKAARYCKRHLEYYAARQRAV